jgi:DNA-binding NtrC family response regulator
MRGAGQHVLFLDDEHDLVQLAEEVLALHHYRVSGYRSAEEAVAALRADASRFDVVVSDLSMPGMSGLDVAREALRLRPDLPVVIISGHLTEDLLAQAAAIGVREVMRKPFEIRALADVIARVT